MTLLQNKVKGRWLHRVGSASTVELVDFRAGGLCTIGPDGNQEFGSPTDFESCEGVRGPDLLERLLPPPTAVQLYRGCLREALVASASIAQLGRQETREWSSPHEYIVDDNEGGRLMLVFVGTEVVGIAFSHDPWRGFRFEEAVLHLPPALQFVANKMGRDRFFEEDSQCQHTALFWSEEGLISSGESWPTTYAYSADLLRSELMGETIWLQETPGRCGISAEAAGVAAKVVRAAQLPVSPLTLPVGALSSILPESAPWRSEGHEALFGAGAFVQETPDIAES